MAEDRASGEPRIRDDKKEEGKGAECGGRQTCVSWSHLSCSVFELSDCF